MAAHLCEQDVEYELRIQRQKTAAKIMFDPLLKAFQEFQT
jgi:hypothetical protein